MDFKLTDEQELIVDSYREYMESENWEAYFAECDEKHVYPLRWVRGLCELGFDQIMLPEEHGGLGLESLRHADGDVRGARPATAPRPTFFTSLPATTPSSARAPRSRSKLSSPRWAQASRFGTPLAPSRVRVPTSPRCRRPTSVRTARSTSTAPRPSSPLPPASSTSSSWRATLTTRTSSPSSSVDMSKPGIKLSPLSKLGLRMDSCCEVYIDNVEIEEKDFFGKEGNGFIRGISDFNFERWLVGACDYGTAIACFRGCVQACQRAHRLRQAGRSLPAELPEVRPHGHQARLHAQHALRDGMERRHNRGGDVDAGELLCASTTAPTPHSRSSTTLCRSSQALRSPASIASSASGATCASTASPAAPTR